MSFLRDCGNPYEENLLAANVEQLSETPVANNTAGAATYTAAEILRGILVRDPSGASRADVFPTAALLIAAIRAKFGDVRVGLVLNFLLVNNADAAETITMTLGAGMTTGVPLGTQVSSAIAQNTTRRFNFRVTNVGAGTEAVVVYA